MATMNIEYNMNYNKVNNKTIHELDKISPPKAATLLKCCLPVNASVIILTSCNIL